MPFINDPNAFMGKRFTRKGGKNHPRELSPVLQLSQEEQDYSAWLKKKDYPEWLRRYIKKNGIEYSRMSQPPATAAPLMTSPPVVPPLQAANPLAGKYAGLSPTAQNRAWYW